VRDAAGGARAGCESVGVNACWLTSKDK
jgi:hypothetical protein